MKQFLRLQWNILGSGWNKLISRFQWDICVSMWKQFQRLQWIFFWGLHERISRSWWFNFFFSFAGALQRSNFYVNCRTIALNPKKCSMCLSRNNLAPCGKALKGVSYKWESFISCENLNIDPGLVERRHREKSLNKFHWNFEIVLYNAIVWNYACVMICDYMFQHIIIRDKKIQ
jgi:hypothetical protein